ncbi:MAG: hypothetical protein K8H88_24475 [Sandaracinaceae bacterium]|nr:hypothetical protein [Sandaracinaceae bacterium]
MAVESRRGLVVVDRAMRGTRVDFFLGRSTEAALEHAIALEVAGTDHGSAAGLLREKHDQAARNPDRLPAIAAVVRFDGPEVIMGDVERG